MSFVRLYNRSVYLCSAVLRLHLQIGVPVFCCVLWLHLQMCVCVEASRDACSRRWFKLEW